MISAEEFRNNFTIERMRFQSDVASFDCEDEDLNDFILNEALLYKNQLLAVPYLVLTKGTERKVAAYFTLSNDKIAITDFPSNNQFNKFKKKNFSQEKYLRSYPSVKIGRFATEKNFKHQGIGTHLLKFIKFFFLENNKTGCRFITVDAYNDAVDFYMKNGFDFLQKRDSEPTQLMFFDLLEIPIVG